MAPGADRALLLEQMNRRLQRVLVVVLALLAGFVLYTGQQLPTAVAAHFDLEGSANHTLSRGVYLLVMTLMVVAVPAIIAFLPPRMARQESRHLNIPHRTRWLAPEHRADTVHFLSLHCGWLALVIGLFLSGLHILVVHANRLQPPLMPMSNLLPAIFVLIVTMAIWHRGLKKRFGTAPPGGDGP